MRRPDIDSSDSLLLFLVHLRIILRNYMIGSVLFFAVAALVIGLFSMLVSWLAGRKRRKEMAADSYIDIATKWALWDHYVNAFDQTELKQAKHMDWETFYSRSTEEKIQMLNDEFGPEKER